jgi:alanyl aminopeptidase
LKRSVLPAAAALLLYLLTARASVAGEPPAGRLSDLARPSAYRLDLVLDPREESFSGSVQIELELARDSEVIWLHGKDLRVSGVSARLPGGRSLHGTYHQRLASGVAELRFEQALPAGPLALVIDYGADYDRNLTGLFKVEEQGDAYVLAKSESIQARRFLPGFDEPGMKAVYHLRLTVPRDCQVITNSPETGRESLGGDLVAVTFAPTRPMSSYLLSLAVGPFDLVERPPLPPNRWRNKPVPLRGFARRGRGDDMNYILDITPGMMAVFEDELQQPYPFEKLDIIAAPQWPSGATELSAAITYREQSILVGDEPAPGARLALVSVHAHEIAHMWFGNLVTPPWWDDLWLKEGFATWGTPLALTLLEPGAGHELTAASRAIAAMRLDSLATTRAIREPVLDNEEVRSAYDAITYSKSLGVIHMVDQYFGAALFRPALGRYLHNFHDASADSPQFYRVIGEETDTPALAETFRSFVEQPGVPLLQARLVCDGEDARFELRQTRYRPLGSTIQPDTTRWSIPLCIRDPAGARSCTLLREKRGEVPLGHCPAWVLPNAGGAGYYRWQLPESQWLALLADFDSLQASEALTVIDSAVAAFEAGELAPGLLWRTVAASASSPERQVVMAPLATLQRYAEYYFNPDQREILGQRLRQWYAPALLRSEDSADPEQQLLHAELLGFMALVARDPAARATLRQQALAFTGFEREADREALSSDLYEAALTVALQDGDERFLRHLIALRAELDDPQFEGASARALGRVQDPALLPRVQALVLSPDMGSREAFDLLQEATATGGVQESNWRWLVQNFPAVTAKIPGQWRRRTPALAGAFCSREGLAELQLLFKRHAELVPGYHRSYDQTTERLRLCIALRPRGEALAAALGE